MDLVERFNDFSVALYAYFGKLQKTTQFSVDVVGRKEGNFHHKPCKILA
jgi:hypothetical protein